MTHFVGMFFTGCEDCTGEFRKSFWELDLVVGVPGRVHARIKHGKIRFET